MDVHVGRLRSELGDAASGSRFIETVRGEGYRRAPLPAGSASATRRRTSSAGWVWTRSIGLRIALVAVGAAVLAVAVVTLGVIVVGGDTFAQLMMQHGSSADAAHAMFDQAISVVLARRSSRRCCRRRWR